MGLIYKGIEIPDNDAARVEAVRSYEILDSDPEEAYDDITELTAALTGCRIAYISIFDDKRSWLKANYGLPPNRPPRPRELSLCSPTICQSDLLIVPDLSENPRYAHLPAVTNPPHAKFYCAMPLINGDGYALGTLCVWDPEPTCLSAEQQQSVRRLARLVLDKLEARRRMLTLREEHDGLRAEAQSAQASAERRDALVRKLFPDPIADRLIADQPILPRFYGAVTVMFIDFVGFSSLAESLEPRELIEQLDEYFSGYDRITDEFGLQKIKTVGDAYLAAAGMLHESKDHAVRVCAAAHKIGAHMDRVNGQRRALGLREWPIRIGIHSGSAIAGIVGRDRVSYDIWGDGVNLARRLQEAAEPGQINLSEATLGLVSNVFGTEPRGAIEAKNKGAVNMYYLLDPR